MMAKCIESNIIGINNLLLLHHMYATYRLFVSTIY